MNDNLLDTPEKQQQAIALFEDMKNHPGWKLFVDILNANIDILRKRLETEEYESLDKMKADQRTRQAYEDARNTPDMIIECYTRKPDEEVEVDPFESIDQFRANLIKSRKKT